MSIKMNNFKTFYECERVIYLKEIIQPPPDESFLRLWNKMFERGFTGTYRHLLSKCSENAVLGRLEMVQSKCFF